MRPYVLGAAALSLCLLTTSGARANGAFPQASQLVVAPNDPTFIVMRTTFGVLVSHDAGDTWDWVCERAVGYSDATAPMLGLLASGTVLVASFDGLFQSSDVGCSWAMAAIDKQAVDLTVDKSNPHAAIVMTSAFDSSNDAGESLFRNKLFATKDDGAHWAPYGVGLDPIVLVETVDIAPSDPHRVYVSGVRSSGPDTAIGVMLTSTDDGAHFTASTIDFTPGEKGVFIAAVDPTDADRVYVRTEGNQGSRLLVSDDGAKTFKTAFTGAGKMLGFALSPDGSKVFLGGPADGVQTASRDDLTFTQRAKIQVQCLMTSGTKLYACSNEASGFVIGTSTDDGETFTAKLHLSCVRGPLACPATSVTGQCAVDFPALQERLGGQCVTGTKDAGPLPGDGGGEPASPGADESSCGCSLVGGPGGATGAALAFAGLAVLATRRRRRSTPPPA
jgi:MYXO-CTERM domain-containing protein